VIGGALQAATQSLDFMVAAHVITIIRTSALTGITPVLISEVSASDHRGGFLGYVFIANYLGISVAYWLSFGLAYVNNGYSDVRWRFLLLLRHTLPYFLVKLVTV
jgi:MFS family permease